MQYFKGDALELKFEAAAVPILTILSGEKDQFYDQAYEVQDLGGVIFDSKLAPLTNAIPRDVFRLAFKEIFDAFIKVGTFEAYITVFKKIFGDSVSIVFTVPGPGKLGIVIGASELELSEFITRYIEMNAYVFDEVITHDGDQIVFQTVMGLSSQYELEQMLFEMVPAGIFTDITLNFGA